MGYNLTNERIQDTYEQLVQISGSTLLDGTGSVITPDVNTISSSYATKASSADTATSASYALVAQTALNAQDAVTTSTFNAYTSSVSSSLATIENELDTIIAGSGSADWLLITNKPSGLVSGSAQTVANLEGENIVATTLKLTAVAGTSIISSSALTLAKLGTSTFLTAQTDIDSIRMQLAGGATRYRQSANSHEFVGNITGSNQTLSGNLSVAGDLSVSGTASFAYLQSITGSAKIIGDAYIILNNDTPAQRYAGVVVQDSGSTQNTASFEFDGQTNDWFYEYTTDGGVTTDHGVALFGPAYNTKGSHVYPTANVIQKGSGGHHLTGSNITDDGTSVNVSTPLTASAFKGDGGGLTNLPFRLANGTGGGNSIITQNLTNTDALAAGIGSIAFGENAQIVNTTSQYAIALGDNALVNNSNRAMSLGNSAQVTNADYSIAIGRTAKVSGAYSLAIELGTTTSNPAGVQTINIGKDINNQNGYSTAIGHNLTNNGTGGNVLIGRSITTSGDYSIGIGEGAQASQQGAVAIGQSANSAGNSVAIGAGATMGSSYGFAGGYNARANNDASIAIGGDVNVSSNQAIAIGTDTTIDASSQGAVSVGQNADIATSTNAVVVGRGAGATGANSGIAIGSGSKVTAANEINIGGIYRYDGSTSASIEDNLTINGQINTPVFAGSVASSTSSIDFDNGNFATLSLTGRTFLASPSSLKSGTTYTIIISSGSLVSGHGTAWKFSGGTAPTYTNGTDVLTCVSDGTNLYATALTDFQ